MRSGGPLEENQPKKEHRQMLILKEHVKAEELVTTDSHSQRLPHIRGMRKRERQKQERSMMINITDSHK